MSDTPEYSDDCNLIRTGKRFLVTLWAVQELSENAILRPAPKKLRCGVWPPPPLQPKKTARADLAWDALQQLARREQQVQASRTNHLYAPIPLACDVDAANLNIGHRPDATAA